MEGWDRTVYDLGTIQLSSKKTGKFVYSGDLNIIGVSASCGCTAAQKTDDKQTNTQVVEFTYDSPDRFSGSGPTMTVSKSITVRFNDGSKNTLSITATINKP